VWWVEVDDDVDCEEVPQAATSIESTTSKENRVAPALSFILDDERELGDTGNLLTL